MSKVSTKKMIAKMEYQARVNPGHKVAYEPKPSRNYTILSGKDKARSRQSRKAETRKMVANW